MARMLALGAVGVLTLASCGNSDAPASQGAVSVHVAQQAGFTCTPMPHWANVPYSATAGQKVFATTVLLDARAVDGDAGMQVTCNVTPDGSKFRVHGDLTSPAGENLTVTHVILDTTIGPDEEGAAGSLRLQDDKSDALFVSSTCTYSVKRATPDDKLAVDAGKIWGTFACTKLSDPGDPGAACSVDRGFFVLENCSQ